MEKAKKQEGTMDMQAMIEVYKKLGAPGAVHKQLSGMVGSWTTKTAYWVEPGRPPAESARTCELKMLLGGRFLQQEYKSESMGETSTGINIIGYNNYTKKYQSLYMDTIMGTPMYYFIGDFALHQCTSCHRLSGLIDYGFKGLNISILRALT